jgi:hypothetical protein
MVRPASFASADYVSLVRLEPSIRERLTARLLLPNQGRIVVARRRIQSTDHAIANEETR